MKMARRWTMALVLILPLVLMNTAHAGAGDTTGQKFGRHSPAQAEQIIAARSDAVVRALKNRDIATFSRYVHPTFGVRFSPYAHAETSHRRFSRAQVQNFYRDTNRYNWGHYDGTGDPIRLTWRDYYFQFIYDIVYTDQAFYNTLHSRGNTLNNLATFYPDAIFVEYYTAPTEANGMDWDSLWQVWQPHNGNWYLVGLAGDRWTI